MTSNRTKLIETGADLMWQAGYTATSPRQVIDASGVGQGSFYHHFPTKADLGVAAIAANAADVLASARAALGGDEPGATRLRRYLLGERDALAGCKVGGLTYDRAVVDDRRLLEPIDEAFEHIEKLVEEAINDAQRDGEIRAEVAARDLASMVIAVVQGGFILARARRDSRLLEGASRAAYELLLTQSAAE